VGTVSVECQKLAKGQVLGGQTQGEDCFVVAVSDTGCGIPASQQAKIFTKFFRADNAREMHTDGNGLGLYIVKSVLDSSGGLLWFHSEENKGTTFYAAIPMAGMRARAGERQLVAA
jgi:signal transduction histidine kinase